MKIAVVAENNPSEMLKLLQSKGLKAKENKSTQKTLDGRTINYHSVTGYKEGSYKITIRFTPEPSVVHFVVSTRSKSSASNLANRLDEELGIDSDVDDNIVRGQTREVSKHVVRRIIELAEEATRS